MAERRPLIEGLKSREAKPEQEEAFVYGQKPVEEDGPKESAVSQRQENRSLQGQGRVPITTRLRPDVAEALKRASLQRQLTGEQPNTLQEIVESILEPWLREQGYLA